MKAARLVKAARAARQVIGRPPLFPIDENLAEILLSASLMPPKAADALHVAAAAARGRKIFVDTELSSHRERSYRQGSR